MFSQNSLQTYNNKIYHKQKPNVIKEAFSAKKCRFVVNPIDIRSCIKRRQLTW